MHNEPCVTGYLEEPLPAYSTCACITITGRCSWLGAMLRIEVRVSHNHGKVELHAVE